MAARSLAFLSSSVTISLPQFAGGCGVGAGVTPGRSIRTLLADALDLAFLQHAEQLALLLQRDLADLVEEQRAAVGELETADAVAQSAGEGASLVAEEFAPRRRGRLRRSGSRHCGSATRDPARGGVGEYRRRGRGRPQSPRPVGAAKLRLERRIAGRRAHSKLPQLVEVMMATPIASSEVIAARLGVTQRAATTLAQELGLREITGRKRYRDWTAA